MDPGREAFGSVSRMFLATCRIAHVPCTFPFFAQDTSAAVGDLNLNAALPAAGQPSASVDPYGAAAAESADAVAAMLAVTSADGTAAVGTAGGSSAMQQKQAFQRVRQAVADTHESSIVLVRPVADIVLSTCAAQELNDFNNASDRVHYYE